MDFRFWKSEELIQHIQACGHLIDYPKEITPEKMECLKLLFSQFSGNSIEEYPNKELVEKVKIRPIPTIDEIEQEFGGKCTCVQDYGFWVQKLFSLWTNKLYPANSLEYLYDKDMKDDVRYLYGQMQLLNYQIIELFKRMEIDSGITMPDLYRKDDIAEIVKKFRGEDVNAVLSQSTLDEVYDECNGKLWQDINKADFKNMLVSGNIGFQIKNGNKQRVVALLNRISFTITDEKAKSAWVANVERALKVERLSKIYELDEMNSEPNKKFNRFLNGIYSK